ncbi:putative cinnamoyl-CoA reductase [Rosa chinensis]|uniref:Putative cinnamoyl-CoA reductase n=1 Tax=Rosa chinensis TaxID=74649 RepID=A0A2P6P570_ROSCH|nr:putative cinnamoyl-CoA reductase [Rosa chinensis]
MSKQGEVVCVTGGSGCIGSWVVCLLLDRGYTVHATVKDLGFHRSRTSGEAPAPQKPKKEPTDDEKRRMKIVAGSLMKAVIRPGGGTNEATRHICHSTLKILLLAEDDGEMKHLEALEGAQTRLRLFQIDLLDYNSISAAIEDFYKFHQ